MERRLNVDRVLAYKIDVTSFLHHRLHVQN